MTRAERMNGWQPKHGAIPPTPARKRLEGGAMEGKQQNARHEDRAKTRNETKSNPATQREQPRRLPTPTELKRAIAPERYYRDRLPVGTPLRAAPDGWIRNIRCVFPDHEDSTGSFGVNLATGAYHCFGCGANGGSIVDCEMAWAGLDLKGARAVLGERYQVEPGTTAATPPRHPAA
ncbi:CHC2 zinc finger domain-containing protein, partial [Thiocapsa sp.]|uniref:CHC2 zinc finger domain-containing protein n=1 Tax=Thiocapsa sp. TaxID=2024551 RepID=UPI003592E933